MRNRAGLGTLTRVASVGSFVALAVGCTAETRDFDSSGTGGAGSSGSSGSSATGTGGGCPEGTVGCPCGPADTCDNGLDCVGGECVEAACKCTDGYEMVGADCVWKGGPNDPSFQDASAWTPVGGSEIQPQGEGASDTGSGYVNPGAVCALGGVSQTFTMPAYACAEPFLLTMNVRVDDCPPGNPFCPHLTLGTRVNGGWTSAPINDGGNASWSAQSICLGERGYGGPVELFIGPLLKPQDCSFTPMDVPGLRVDNVAIVPDTQKQCPAPGQVLNGDFEEGPIKWEAIATGGQAEIAKGLGNGAFAGRIATTNLCQSPQLKGTGSLPLGSTTPNPALRLWQKGTPGHPVNVFMNGFRLGWLGENGTPATTMCLPTWAQGSVQSVSFSFLLPQQQVCNDPSVAELIVDDLAFGSDPDCPAVADIIDPGFENIASKPNIAPTWQFSAFDPGTAASMDVGPGAHSGSVALELSASNVCFGCVADTVITVPQPKAAEGPVVKFWYRAPLLKSATAVMRPGGTPLKPAASWTQASTCLDPGLAGRPLAIQFSIDGGSGTCANTFPKETLWVDDVELGTDAGCPAK